MQCPKCKTVNDVDSKFCCKCGGKLPEVSAPSDSQAGGFLDKVDGEIKKMDSEIDQKINGINREIGVDTRFVESREKPVVKIVSHVTGTVTQGERKIQDIKSPKNTITIITSDGRRVPASIVKIIESCDLALIKSEAYIGEPLAVNEGPEPGRGSTVIAIGSPLGLPGSITKGIVSAVRERNNIAFIQTDVAINPGNSGGPLFSGDGIVIGVNRQKVAFTEGLGFAVSARHIIEHFSGLISCRSRVGQTISNKNFLDHLASSVVTIETEVGSGSGFVISKDGYIVTNVHVVAPKNEESE